MIEVALAVLAAALSAVLVARIAVRGIVEVERERRAEAEARRTLREERLAAVEVRLKVTEDRVVEINNRTLNLRGR